MLSRQNWSSNCRGPLVSIVKELQVVNDITETGVALTEDYNRLMKKNKNRCNMLFLLQVVEHRRSFLNCNKTTLLSRRSK